MIDDSIDYLVGQFHGVSFTEQRKAEQTAAQPNRAGRPALVKGEYATGGMFTTPDGAVNVPVRIRITVGERLIGANGKVWEWTEVPDTDPQMYQWVRVNTDEQAAEWVAQVRGRLSKFNQPKEPA